jgi:hypothetical protein
MFAGLDEPAQPEMKAPVASPQGEATFATLRIRKVGTRPGSVKVGRKKIGNAPLESAVPAGRQRVIVQCGRRSVVNEWLVFDAGDVREIDVM